MSATSSDATVERRGPRRWAAYNDSLTGIEIRGATRDAATSDLAHLTRFVEERAS